MSSNNFFKSDLEKIHNIIQGSMLVYPKEIIIEFLRNLFSKDSYYHYSRDQWGFANTTDHTDLPLGSDIPKQQEEDGLSTRLFIGENYRYTGIYYPAVLVKNSGSKYVPISLNRNKSTVKYDKVMYEDRYGNKSFVTRPVAFVTAGAWEGQFTIDVVTRSLRSRDDIVEMISLALTDIHFESLVDVGVIIKPISIGGPSESDDRGDKLFRQSINLDVRTEWRREIPINRLIEQINFTIEFRNLLNNDAPTAHNLTINTNVSVEDFL